MNKLIFLLLLKALFLGFVIQFLNISLSPDEAQYWTWSQDLDWGYYSKPPGIAWQIFLTTHLLGNTELGVRFGAIIMGFFLPIAIYYLSYSCGLSKKASFWSALLFAATPLGFYLSFAATTDGGSFLGLTMAVAVFAKALYQKKLPNYFLIGFWVSVGALFKWTTFVIYPFIFLLWFIYPWIRSKNIFFGLLISLCALLPSLYWNISHDFATFKHVFYTFVNPSTGTAKNGNFLDFLGAQIALLSPIVFGLFLIALFKRKENRALTFCSLFSSGFLIYLMLSLTKKMQPNWAAYFYPVAIVLVGWYGMEILKKGAIWIYAAFALALFFSLGAFALPYTKAPYQWNPFRQALGWNSLHKALEERGYRANEDFLFADTYQMTSLLSFYGPDQQRAYFVNLRGNRKNQFSYWPSIEEKQGKTGYFVVAEHTDFENPWYEGHYRKKLSSACEDLEYLGSESLYEAKGKSVKRAFFFRCKNLQRKMFQDPEKY